MHRYNIEWIEIDEDKKSLKGVLSYAEYMGASVEIAEVNVSPNSTGIARGDEFKDTYYIGLSEEDTERIMEMMRHYRWGYFKEDYPFTWIKDKEEVPECQRFSGDCSDEKECYGNDGASTDGAWPSKHPDIDEYGYSDPNDFFRNMK